MKPYRYPQVKNIYFGDGVVKTLGTIVATEGVKKVLVVTEVHSASDDEPAAA